MQSLFPKTRTNRLKLALTLCAIAIGARALIYILHLPEWFIPDLHMKSEHAFRFFHTFLQLLSLFSPILAILGLISLYRLRIFTSHHQRVAVIALQVVLVHGILLITPFALASIETIFRESLGFHSAFYFNTWLFNNQWIVFGTGYAHYLWWVAWIVLLCPPSFKLNQWSSKREKICRAIGFALVVFSLWPTLTYYIYRINPLDFADDPYSRIKAFLNHTSIVARWGFLAAFTAALTFLTHLRRNAHQLIYDPNHCTNCAYPLDQSITTCPECGHTRPAPIPPLPEG